MYAQILKYLKSKYLLFFSVHRFFRYAGMDVTPANECSERPETRSWVVWII